MYICNLKLDFKKMFIIIAIIVVIIALVIEISNKSGDTKSYDYVLDSKNFTSILKEVHDNIDGNVGKSIKLSGFVFRLPDFKEGYFVCGRNMLLDNDEKVVGFLCYYDKEFSLKDSEWVELTGEFVKGYYTTDMPVVQVKSIKSVTAPAETFVETPDFLN